MTAPLRSNTIARELVVPWSIDKMWLVVMVVSAKRVAGRIVVKLDCNAMIPPMFGFSPVWGTGDAKANQTKMEILKMFV